MSKQLVHSILRIQMDDVGVHTRLYIFQIFVHNIVMLECELKDGFCGRRRGDKHCFPANRSPTKLN